MNTLKINISGVNMGPGAVHFPWSSLNPDLRKINTNIPKCRSWLEVHSAAIIVKSSCYGTWFLINIIKWNFGKKSYFMYQSVRNTFQMKFKGILQCRIYRIVICQRQQIFFKMFMMSSTPKYLPFDNYNCV